MNSMTKWDRTVKAATKGSALFVMLVLFSIAVFASEASERRSAAPANTSDRVSVTKAAALDATARDMANVQPVADTAEMTSAAGSSPDELVLVRRLYELYGRWYDTASNALAEKGVEPNGPRATQVYSLLGLSQNGAAVACWAALAEDGRLSDAVFNRCVAGASMRILEYLFSGDASASCMAIKNPIPGQISEGAELSYDLIAAQVLGQLAANDVIASGGAALR
jgi:hypothetical protein